MYRLHAEEKRIEDQKEEIDFHPKRGENIVVDLQIKEGGEGESKGKE